MKVWFSFASREYGISSIINDTDLLDKRYVEDYISYDVPNKVMELSNKKRESIAKYIVDHYRDIVRELSKGMMYEVVINKCIIKIYRP